MTLRLCVTDRTSVLIVSVARRIAADDVEILASYTEHDQCRTMRINNPRLIYSVTVGRLSWKMGDLAAVYNAKCAVGANCDGLNVSFGNETELVLDADHVPEPHSILNPPACKTWQGLAIANTFTDSMTTDIIYPPARRTASRGCSEAAAIAHITERST